MTLLIFFRIRREYHSKQVSNEPISLKDQDQLLIFVANEEISNSCFLLIHIGI